MDASARGKLIYKLANLIERDIEYLSNLESLDNGKPYGDSVFDMNCAIDTFKYYAGWCDKIHGNTIPSGKPILLIDTLYSNKIFYKIEYFLDLLYCSFIILYFK